MPKKTLKHLHIYKRKNLSRDKSKPYLVLACIDVLCSNYIPLNLAEGKMCACYHCKNPMVIDKKALQNVKIHCTSCTKESHNRKPKLDLVGIVEGDV